jgi:hypothetical protein
MPVAKKANKSGINSSILTDETTAYIENSIEINLKRESVHVNSIVS